MSALAKANRRRGMTSTLTTLAERFGIIGLWGVMIGVYSAVESSGFDTHGTFTTILGRSLGPAGGLAPWSIHSLISASSCGVSGSSLLGGMYGRTSLADSFTSRLSADLPGTTAGPRLPPRINASPSGP